MWARYDLLMRILHYSERFADIVYCMFQEYSVTHQIVFMAIIDERIVQFGNHVIDPFNDTYDSRSTAVNVFRTYTNICAGIIYLEYYQKVTIL